MEEREELQVQLSKVIIQTWRLMIWKWDNNLPGWYFRYHHGKNSMMRCHSLINRIISPNKQGLHVLIAVFILNTERNNCNNISICQRTWEKTRERKRQSPNWLSIELAWTMLRASDDTISSPVVRSSQAILLRILVALERCVKGKNGEVRYIKSFREDKNVSRWTCRGEKCFA